MGTLRMYTTPGYTPSTRPLQAWDGNTNNYIYVTWGAILSTSNALAGGMQADLRTAEQYADQGTTTEAQTRATADLALSNALLAAIAVAQTNLSAGIAAAAAAGSNYAWACANGAYTAAVAASAQSISSTSSTLRAYSDAISNTLVAALAAEQAARFSGDTNSAVALATATNALWLAGAGVSLDTAATSGNSTTNDLVVVDPSGRGDTRIGSGSITVTTGDGVGATNSVRLGVFGGDGSATLTLSGGGGKWIFANWGGNIYAATEAELNGKLDLAGDGSQLTGITAVQVGADPAGAATNAVDPVARASAAAKPSYAAVTNIVSHYAAPSFPIWDSGFQSNIVFACSNGVVSMYLRSP
jgi:hypothetical protein